MEHLVLCNFLCYQQRPNCSSTETRFACLWQDDYFLISRRTSVFLSVPFVLEIGKMNQNWDTCIWRLQFSTDKLLTYTEGSSISSPRHVLLSYESVWICCWMQLAMTIIAYTGYQGEWDTCQVYFLDCFGPDQAIHCIWQSEIWLNQYKSRTNGCTVVKSLSVVCTKLCELQLLMHIIL